MDSLSGPKNPWNNFTSTQKATAVTLGMGAAAGGIYYVWSTKNDTPVVNFGKVAAAVAILVFSHIASGYFIKNSSGTKVGPSSGPSGSSLSPTMVKPLPIPPASGLLRSEDPNSCPSNSSSNSKTPPKAPPGSPRKTSSYVSAKDEVNDGIPYLPIRVQANQTATPVTTTTTTSTTTIPSLEGDHWTYYSDVKAKADATTSIMKDKVGTETMVLQPTPLLALTAAIREKGFASVKEQVASLEFDEFKQFLQMEITPGGQRYVLHEIGVLDVLLKLYPKDSPLTEKQQEKLASLFHFGKDYDDGTLSLLFTHCRRDQLYDLLERLDRKAVYDILNRTRHPSAYSYYKVFSFMDPTPRVIKFLNTLDNDDCKILLETDWKLFSKMIKNKSIEGLEEVQEIDLGAMTGLCIKMDDYETLCNWMAPNPKIKYNPRKFKSIFEKMPLEGIAALLKHSELKEKINWEWAQPSVQKHYPSHVQSARFFEDEEWLYFLKKSYRVQESRASLLIKKLTDNKFLSNDINAIQVEVLQDLKFLTHTGLKRILTYQVEQDFKCDGFLAKGKSFMQYTEVLDEILRRYATSVISSIDDSGWAVMLADKDQQKKKKEVMELFCAKDQNGQTLYSLHYQNEQVQQLLKKLYEWQTKKVMKKAGIAMESAGTKQETENKALEFNKDNTKMLTS